jgi:hypothetical protein
MVVLWRDRDRSVGSEKGGAQVEQVSTTVRMKRTDLPAEMKITSYQSEIRVAQTTKG